jgi:hypothetical protein
MPATRLAAESARLNRNTWRPISVFRQQVQPSLLFFMCIPSPPQVLVASPTPTQHETSSGFKGWGTTPTGRASSPPAVHLGMVEKLWLQVREVVRLHPLCPFLEVRAEPSSSDAAWQMRDAPWASVPQVPLAYEDDLRVADGRYGRIIYPGRIVHAGLYPKKTAINRRLA